MSPKRVAYKVRCHTCGFETSAFIEPAEGVLLELCPVDPANCPQCSRPFRFDILAGPFGVGPRQPPVGLVTNVTTTGSPGKPGLVVSQDAASLAAEHGIDLSELAGSGEAGQIILADVEAAVLAQDNVMAERLAQASGGKGE